MEEDTLKKCAKCQEQKPATHQYFHRDKNKQDGLNTWCKVCLSEYYQSKKSYYQEKGRLYYHSQDNEKAREKARAAYYANIEKRRQAARDYAATHRDKTRQAGREYSAAHREERNRKAAEWAKKYPEKNKARYTRYRNRRASNEGSYTKAEWESLCLFYDHRCLCCGEQKPLTTDHVVPVSKGGSNYISNIQPLCRECNGKKGTQIIDYRLSPKWAKPSVLSTLDR